jgi:DNA-binding MarR family transcriptional regulator
MPDPILFDLVRLQELLRVTLDRARRDAGLGASEHVVLRALDAEPGLSGAAIARAAGVTPQSMHGVLVRLQRDGAIAASPHPTDRRLRVFSLTTAGRLAAASAAARLEEIEAHLTGELTDEERVRLATAARTCVETLEAGVKRAGSRPEAAPEDAEVSGPA